LFEVDELDDLEMVNDLIDEIVVLTDILLIEVELDELDSNDEIIDEVHDEVYAILIKHAFEDLEMLYDICEHYKIEMLDEVVHEEMLIELFDEFEYLMIFHEK
jgi:hypothetical protein